MPLSAALTSLGWLAACSAPAPDAGSAPRIGTGSSVHVLMVGDTGSDTEDRSAVFEGMQVRCRALDCDAIVLLGDLIYPRGAESPDDERLDRLIGVYAQLAPVYLAVGNHDYGHGRDHEAVGHLQAWAAQTDDVFLPSTVYQAPLGDDLGTLAVIDTNHIFQYGDTPIGQGSAFTSQGAWLDAIAQAHGPLFVAGHHPYRSNGPHGNAGVYEGWRHLPWASGNALRSFFDDHVAQHARLYAAGHDHNLQLLPCEAAMCAVAGSGAKVRELVDRGNPTHYQASRPGFVALELSEDAAFIAAFGVDGTELARVPLTAPGDGRFH